jgi:hypothetical protein
MRPALPILFDYGYRIYGYSSRHSYEVVWYLEHISSYITAAASPESILKFMYWSPDLSEQKRF